MTSWNYKPKARNQIFAILRTLCPNKYILNEVVYSGREAVEMYLNSSAVRSKVPLVFRGEGTFQNKYTRQVIDISAELSTKESLDDKILFILQTTRSYGSYKKDDTSGYYESSASRRRSSLDLWRHLITYYPEYTIFDVMHSLYSLQLNRLVNNNYCHDVHRRVFLPGWYGNYNAKDEYGLNFSDWENI
jgi:hypothetical protein